MTRISRIFTDSIPAEPESGGKRAAVQNSSRVLVTMNNRASVWTAVTSVPLLGSQRTLDRKDMADNSKMSSFDRAAWFSLILGVVSLFGIQRHRRKLTLWIALFGILANCAALFVALELLIFMSGTSRY
jgi:hypothetical protein